MYESCTEKITRASALRLRRFVRGLPPTPAKVRSKSLAPLRSWSLAGHWPCAVCPDGLRYRSDYQGTRRTIGGFARQARKSPGGRPLSCSAPHRSTPLVRGLPPTPAKVRSKSLAPWQQGHSASFVGYRPHPPRCAANPNHVPRKGESCTETSRN